MRHGGLQRIVAIDWSGRVDASGQRRHIWSGIWSAPSSPSSEGKITLEAGRTREELVDWLIEMSHETPRMVVSVDCCFSFPGWFLAEHGCTTIFDFWRHVAAGHGERWLARECDDVMRDERFWGKPHKRPAQFCGTGLHRSMRFTDMDNKITPKLEDGDHERAAKMKGITPKSPFQIGGSGSVGTGSLRAMPFLLALHDAGFRIWPFESAQLTGRKPQPLLVEMYTRLLTGPVAKSNPEARSVYLAAKKKTDAAYAKLTRDVLSKAMDSEDAFDALVCVMEMVHSQNDFASLKATQDELLRLEGITWRPGVQA